MKGKDIVYITCPKCGEKVVFSKKSEEAESKGFSQDGVPFYLALSLQEDVEECPKCNSLVEFAISGIPFLVRTVGVVFTPHED